MSSLSAGNAVWQREFDLSLGILHTVVSLQVLGGNHSSSDDLDGSRTSAMAPSHFIVQLRDGTGKCNISVLSVHVVCSTSRGITKPNTKVLDNICVLLNNFHAVKDLSSGLLHLTELVHVIPELRLGNNSVRSEDDHSVSLGVGMILGGSLSANHLVLLHDTGDSHLNEQNKKKVCEWTCFLDTKEYAPFLPGRLHPEDGFKLVDGEPRELEVNFRGDRCIDGLGEPKLTTTGEN